jgi:hypothetical protein
MIPFDWHGDCRDEGVPILSPYKAKCNHRPCPLHTSVSVAIYASDMHVIRRIKEGPQ